MGEEQQEDNDENESCTFTKMTNETKADLISMDLISEIVSNLFNDTAHLFNLRQNRAAILLRKCEIEKSINESIGIFAKDDRGLNKASVINNNSLFIESYVSEVFKHCKPLDWSSESVQINLSVFIHMETISNRSEEQQIFDNLIFDTLNEVLLDFKSNTNNCCPTQKQIIQIVQDKMSKITICQTAKQLKEHFVDEQVIDDRIRRISNEWIQEFEKSHKWNATFDTFKKSMKVQIADLILDQILTDTVDELNQIERCRQL